MFELFPGPFIMSLIIQDLTYFETEREVEVPDGQQFLIKRHQIVVWISLTDLSQTLFSQATPKFPALIDTGFNHNFLIQARHLVRWARIRPTSLDLLKIATVWGVRTKLYEANLWLHRYPESLGESEGSPGPFGLPLNDGIMVTPPFMHGADGSIKRYTYPRIPLLGMRALRESDLHLLVDTENLRVSIRVP
jgi:hypothetical protein